MLQVQLYALRVNQNVVDFFVCLFLANKTYHFEDAQWSTKCEIN